MQFKETSLAGAYVVELDVFEDDRGFFARGFCAEEFSKLGLKPEVKQANISSNHKKGTLRGLHYQMLPAVEAKFIRCTKGAIYDVICDLREDSPTYMQHFGVELTAENRRALYIPEMFAHGYQTLEDNTEVFYQVSEFYTPNVESGYRYDDPKLDISWPLEVSTISEKDLSWPYIK